MRGQEKVVVLPVEEYKRLTAPPVPLNTFFRESPLYGLDLDLEHRSDPGRDVLL